MIKPKLTIEEIQTRLLMMAKNARARRRSNVRTNVAAAKKIFSEEENMPPLPWEAENQTDT